MFYYDFSIAGLRLRVESEFALQDLYELTHYAVPYSPDVPCDVRYSLACLPDDWQVRGERIIQDRQNAVYRWQNQQHRYYFWNLLSEDRFIVSCCDLNDLGRCAIYLQRRDVERLLPQFRLSAFFGLERVLLERQAFQLHASVIDWHGQGILFTAPSGTGKSTQADLWCRLEEAQVLNGDRAIISCNQSPVTVCGSPYAGSSGIYTNAEVPVRAVVALSQAPENTLEHLSPLAAFRWLYPQVTVLSWDHGFVDGISQLLLKLIDSVPVYHLACRPDADAVAVLKRELIK